MAENKVNFGLKNVHYSKITIDLQGKVQYGPPVRIPGAVELSLEPRGDMSEFYADDILYYSSGANQGYDGTLTIANIPQQFAEECLGEKRDAEHLVSTESVTDKGANFALMFEFDGDQKARRHILYNCSANRPTVGSSTKTNTTEPFTNELTFVAMATEDFRVKTKTIDETPAHIYDAWFRKVYDGIKNTINRAAPSYSKGTAGALTLTVTSPETLTVSKVTNNGVALTETTHYTYLDGTFTLTEEYLTGLENADTQNAYNIIIETNKGNDILVKLEVTA